jgi:hypothetical protein
METTLRIQASDMVHHYLFHSAASVSLLFILQCEECSECWFYRYSHRNMLRDFLGDSVKVYNNSQAFFRQLTCEIFQNITCVHCALFSLP